MKFVPAMLTAVSLVAVTALSFADLAPHNCDSTPPPAGYAIQKPTDGSTAWRNCYMDSAVGECKLGHTLKHIACTTDSLNFGLSFEYADGHYVNDCTQEAAYGYLPAGVTAAACVLDWACYEDASKCSH